MVYGWFCIIFHRLIKSIIWSSLENFKDNCDKKKSSTWASFFFSLFLCLLSYSFITTIEIFLSTMRRAQNIKRIRSEFQKKQVVWKLYIPTRLSCKKKVRDGTGRMKFATFGAYSISFHVSFDFVRMDIFFQIFSIIVQKCGHKASSSNTFVFLSFH